MSLRSLYLKAQDKVVWLICVCACSHFIRTNPINLSILSPTHPPSTIVLVFTSLFASLVSLMPSWFVFIGLIFSPVSPGNNTCFYGKCYYCRESEPACAEGEIMEGSLTLWLPDVWPLQKHRHPWGRTYREGKLARWVSSVSPKKQRFLQLGEILWLEFILVFWCCCCCQHIK